MNGRSVVCSRYYHIMTVNVCRWIENYFISRDTLLDSMSGLLRRIVGGWYIYPGVRRFEIAEPLYFTQVSFVRCIEPARLEICSVGQERRVQKEFKIT
jgi:hypothetical protein